MTGTVFSTALGAILPLVLLISLGYILRQKHFLTDAFLAVGSKLVFRVGLPVVLFSSVYGIESLDQVRWDIALYCMGAVTVIFVLGILSALAVTAVPERRGVLVQCTYRSNYAIVGISLATALGGGQALAVAAVLAALLVPYFNVLAVLALSLFLEEGGCGRGSWRAVAGKVAGNPLIWGVLAGLAALLVRRWQEVHLGTVVFSLERDLGPVFAALQELGRMTTPFSLLVLGGQFRFSAARGMLREIVAGTLWRTVLTPVLGVGGAVVLSRLGLLACGPEVYPALLALFGSPVAVSSAIMAREMGNDEQLAAQLLVWTSLASIGTIFLGVCVLAGLAVI